MDGKRDKIVALANMISYDSVSVRKYIDGAPHIKHSMLRILYSKLALMVYDFATRYTPNPKILDLGTGEGTAILPFLELGAEVTAVDISENQLKALETKCSKYAGKLKVRRQDIFDAIKSIQSEERVYDVITVNSFLHHVPDYLGLIRQIVTVLSPHGQFFSFQDHLRYDSLGRFPMIFNTLAYLSWRIFQSDRMGGIKRRIRRNKKIYVDEEDSVEYHALRGGVDQEAIFKLFNQLGFECEIFRYFSTQSSIWQPIGTALGIKNTFAVIARRCFG